MIKQSIHHNARTVQSFNVDKINGLALPISIRKITDTIDNVSNVSYSISRNENYTGTMFCPLALKELYNLIGSILKDE